MGVGVSAIQIWVLLEFYEAALFGPVAEVRRRGGRRHCCAGRSVGRAGGRAAGRAFLLIQLGLSVQLFVLQRKFNLF